MPKQAPTLPKLLTMVVFALSCFGLLLFLWLSFGGPIPLKPKGYRFQVAFPEAATLGLEADVRIAGVTVGKVRGKDLADGGSRTLVEIEMDREYAPIQRDAKVMLRQKTLLGETYVQLVPGRGGRLPEGGRLADGRVQNTVQLDEIFDALDPQTREAFRGWQQELARGIEGRGRDVNDALGTLPGFAADADDVLAVLDSQEQALGRLVKNTGVVFGALTENEAQLRNLITSSKRVFDATASQHEALAETIRIFPVFLDESKATMARLKTFSRDARALVQDLRPVARDLKPTLRDTRALAPDLERFFTDLDPLITASKQGMPATREILRGLKPMLAEVGPFLGQLNPLLNYLEVSQAQVVDFISIGGAALADTTSSPGGGVGHYLRQFGPTGAESAAIWRERLKSNRGNAYINATRMPGPKSGQFRIFPSWDCKPSGGETKAKSDGPGCYVQDRLPYQGRLQTTFPRAQAEDYGPR